MLSSCVWVLGWVCGVQVEDHSPHRTFKEFMGDIFDTARNLTTSYLLVFVVGNGMLGISPFNVTTNLQVPSSSTKKSST